MIKKLKEFILFHLCGHISPATFEDLIAPFAEHRKQEILEDISLFGATFPGAYDWRYEIEKEIKHA